MFKTLLKGSTVSKKLLTLIAIMGLGSMQVMAQGEVAFTAGNTIGATNNSDGWYGAKSEIFEIPANKTLTLKFKTYSATDEQLATLSKTWGAYMSHVINLWTANGDYGNLFWRADGYGWWGDKNTNGSGWFTYLGANTRWGVASTDEGVTYDGQLLREDLTGSDVVFTIARVGAELRMMQEFTATSGIYQRYFVVNYGYADQSIWAQLAIENAHVTVSENYAVTDTEVPAITGTQVGLDNNTSGFWTAWSDYFTVEPGKSLTLRYKLYTNRINNWNGAAAYVTTDFDRGATGYTEYFGLRPDNYENVAKVSAKTCNFDQISWNWGVFRQKLDGSTVTLTLTREGAKVSVREEFAPADGSTTLYEEYDQDCGDGTQNIRVFLALEGAHIDLLPATTTISSYGWSTFCNADYALSFAGIEGLKAYMVIDHTDTALTLDEVTGTVPAGTPLLLSGTAGQAYNIPIVGSSATNVSTNLLKAGTGAAVTAEDGKTKYVLSVNDGKAEFQKINTNAATVAAGKAYLEFDELISAPALSLDLGTTAIKAVESRQAAEGFFNLAGQRVAQPQKGLYIVNGKKIIVK